MATLTLNSWTRCKTCDKFKLTEKEFNVGDKVDYVHRRQNGKSIQFSQRTGKILTINGERIGVIYRKRLEVFSPSELNDPNGASQLSVSMIGQCGCKGSK